MIGCQEWSDVSLMTIIATYLSMFAVDDSFDAIQIKCDREVSRGAFMFVDKCKPIKKIFCSQLVKWSDVIYCDKIWGAANFVNTTKVFWLKLFKAAEWLTASLTCIWRHFCSCQGSELFSVCCRKFAFCIATQMTSDQTKFDKLFTKA